MHVTVSARSLGWVCKRERERDTHSDGMIEGLFVVLVVRLFQRAKGCLGEIADTLEHGLDHVAILYALQLAHARSLSLSFAHLLLVLAHDTDELMRVSRLPCAGNDERQLAEVPGWCASSQH